IEDYEYDIAGTVCEEVIVADSFIHYPDKIIDFFPDNPILKELSAVSYMGVPLKDIDGKALGYIAVLDTKPIPEDPRLVGIFNIFAARAAAELQRLRAESQVRERERKLSQLVDSAMDTIIELEARANVKMINPAGEDLFGLSAQEMQGRNLTEFLTKVSGVRLLELLKELHLLPEDKRSLWIPGGLKAMMGNGTEFSAEATLSGFEVEGQPYYTLILRNVNDRLEAERKINTLIDEAQYLQEEIKELQNFDEIIGNSKAIKKVLNEIKQVAGTDASVLVTGETGTGKELVARAIHAESKRKNKPLLKVNCAAISPALMESEFFGHEKGAFTGATSKREGRFSLANGGTIFLDEIGELPLDLQSKLLRVLQEREFEPVGSSRSVKVDVRVICATNRDLRQMVEDKKFREDLYYRLDVFPIEIPPLRDRGDDIALLASVFADKCAKRFGKIIDPLSVNCIRRLLDYDWPGNIREMQNVIERAIITSPSSKINLELTLSGIFETKYNKEINSTEESSKIIRTEKELKELEYQNLIQALESTKWRIYGTDGAAELLGMNPSTLRSRIKTFGIKRPQ
ncbi:MAG: sigma 54-interacting transcriptional regulator, partial [Deltaproteobacteria bacterium]|nr:sigma 54-interacting transcriptional regulator [Deltaproteobacteria bacterium]